MDGEWGMGNREWGLDFKMGNALGPPRYVLRERLLSANTNSKPIFESNSVGYKNLCILEFLFGLMMVENGLMLVKDGWIWLNLV